MKKRRGSRQNARNVTTMQTRTSKTAGKGGLTALILIKAKCTHSAVSPKNYGFIPQIDRRNAVEGYLETCGRLEIGSGRISEVDECRFRPYDALVIADASMLTLRGASRARWR